MSDQRPVNLERAREALDVITIAQWLTMAASAVLFVVMVTTLVASDELSAAELGEVIGGFTSGIALLWLVVGQFSQREALRHSVDALSEQLEDLRQNREVFREQRDALRAQAEAAAAQSEAFAVQIEEQKRFAMEERKRRQVEVRPQLSLGKVTFERNGDDLIAAVNVKIEANALARLSVLAPQDAGSEAQGVAALSYRQAGHMERVTLRYPHSEGDHLFAVLVESTAGEVLLGGLVATVGSGHSVQSIGLHPLGNL